MNTETPELIRCECGCGTVLPHQEPKNGRQQRFIAGHANAYNAALNKGKPRQPHTIQKRCGYRQSRGYGSQYAFAQDAGAHVAGDRHSSGRAH